MVYSTNIFSLEIYQSYLFGEIVETSSGKVVKLAQIKNIILKKSKQERAKDEQHHISKHT